MNFPYELSCEELFDLLAGRRVTFRVESSALLDNMFMHRIDVKPMRDD